MIDYSLWEVIENGNAPPIKKVVEGVETIIAPSTTEEKAQRRLELKSRSTLLMGILNEHKLKFNSIKDAKSLLQAIEKRFGGNAATKKTQRNLLKNKPEIDTLSLDDLYNNLKIYELEVKGTSSSSTNTQNIAFVSSNSTNSTNRAVNTTHDVTTTSTQATAVNSTTIDNLSDAMAMLTIRARRFLKNTVRKLTVNGTETIGFNKSKVECYNYHKRGNFARECMAPMNQENKNRENTRRVMPVETTTSNALISCDGHGLESVEARLLVYKKNESVYEEDIKLLKRKIYLKEVAITELSEGKVGMAQNTKRMKYYVNSARPMSNVFNKAHLTVRRPINNKTAVKNNNFIQRVNIVMDKKINTARPKAAVNAARPKAVIYVVQENQGNPQQDLHDKGVIDSGCSNHMTRNMSYLTDFEEIDGGYVTFGGNPKGGKITSRATKDETSGILKSFITEVENLIDQRVKVIRCDNGTEFKNKEMNQFCERKSMKREFSVARTPQQNGAEVVNTACYVQNRVLVTKPHNKTPYELFLGRKPALGFMRPFGCPVTILNTIDHLGKFDGKADEGFFVGYSINSKAFRVFNSRTRIVEENLHVQFSENTPNITGSGPNWLFDIDALTKSMNYKPVVTRNQSNGNAGTKACDDAGKMETIRGKYYILLPLWHADPLFAQSSKSSPDVEFRPSRDDEKKVTEEPGKEGGDSSKEDESNDQEKDDNVNNTNNVNAASTNEVNVVGRKSSIKLPDDPNMPELEDIIYADDDEDVGA
ncbi:ribonuclease H-like domain-containing protein [Tanacetum coccineum]